MSSLLQQLCIELSTVLHRLLLSSQEAEIQQVILDIVYKCTQAVGENTKISKEQNGENEVQDGRENEITSKKSVVFSLLEICMYMVSNYAHTVMPEDSLQTTNTLTRKQGCCFYFYFYSRVNSIRFYQLLLLDISIIKPI